MADKETVPPNITFHEGASEEFSHAVLDAYAAIPPAIRRRLASFAGVQTLIRTVRGAPNRSGPWIGLSTPPSYQSRHPAEILEDRAITRFGRPRLTLAEYSAAFPDQRLPGPYVVRTLHHEIGHRIDAAISGDNYIDQPPDEWPWNPTRRFSASASFIEALRQDLLDAGWRPGEPPPPDLGVSPRLLPMLLRASDQVGWRLAAGEAFADLYARRFSTSLDDQSFLPQAARTDFSIFGRTGLLVDRAVATFAGESVVPLNPNPGDYRPGERAHPLARTPLFEPVGPDAPHPPHPRPPRTSP